MFLLASIAKDLILNREKSRKSFFFFSGLALISTLYSAFDLYIPSSVSQYSPKTIRDIPVWVTIVSQGVGVFALLTLAVRSFNNWKTGSIEIFFCFLVVFQTAINLNFGTWLSTDIYTPTQSELREKFKDNIYPYGDEYLANAMGSKILLTLEGLSKQISI